MPSGLQIWNENGVLMLDGTHRIGRVKGTVRISAPGSVLVDLSDGTPFWSFQPDQLFFHISQETAPPIISIDARGVYWTYSSIAGMAHGEYVKGTLIYGVY